MNTNSQNITFNYCREYSKARYTFGVTFYYRLNRIIQILNIYYIVNFLLGDSCSESEQIYLISKFYYQANLRLIFKRNEALETLFLLKYYIHHVCTVLALFAKIHVNKVNIVTYKGETEKIVQMQ